MGQVERGVILAAGLGTRLKWLTHGRPKALMQVGGEPAIVHVIRALVRQGVREIAVNIHHHADQMRACLGDGSRFGCHLSISYEAALLDSGGGVKQALDLLPGNSPFVVWNADVLSDIDVQVLAAALPASCDAAIGLVSNPAHHARGDFALERGYVMSEGSERFTFSGVSVWRAHALDAYSSGDLFSLTQPMRALIAKRRCAGLLHRGRWFDIGRPRDLMLANRFLGAG
ncbi:MAG: nucleotidyl transferase [Zetaproteobacteria bacterium CG12_big_fil_rev_8_21_14_0_65_54_13]|nr:MAG: nucleotidyl transferase [Zetaproteobacteria bacterium CG12_big_fil_rev_8_21_14_0_65_54_13]PIX55351.1 MAG: nucleotidyl transferase [Zetaproteobacteria bacterium CG_4_10_14_3_um_filter_54_28]PJA27291.1 MAG: nucleotidyl transferase [Zetaproteobacteria bacterium CG_4_9_14_3_um_filter_54_145]